MDKKQRTEKTRGLGSSARNPCVIFICSLGFWPLPAFSCMAGFGWPKKRATKSCVRWGWRGVSWVLPWPSSGHSQEASEQIAKIFGLLQDETLKKQLNEKSIFLKLMMLVAIGIVWKDLFNYNSRYFNKFLWNKKKHNWKIFVEKKTHGRFLKEIYKLIIAIHTHEMIQKTIGGKNKREINPAQQETVA